MNFNNSETTGNYLPTRSNFDLGTLEFSKKSSAQEFTAKRFVSIRKN